MTVVINPPISVLERLASEGYLEGAPGHVSPAALAVDRAAVRCARCARCRKRGMACKMFRKGPRYAVVAVCCCGYQEEV
jgi:hypothetical protein